ncbi:exported hypothetical protein [Ralstonia solanacearum K60]|nr:exported hypothetical protein [Ralstonia solanacearum K60]
MTGRDKWMVTVSRSVVVPSSSGVLLAGSGKATAAHAASSHAIMTQQISVSAFLAASVIWFPVCA